MCGSKDMLNNAGVNNMPGFPPTTPQPLDERNITYTSGNPTLYTIDPKFPGMTQQGNIDITNRPTVKIGDDMYGTVRSVNFSVDKQGTQVLIPTIGPAGENWTIKQALAHYRTTGENLGYFKDPASAEKYAVALHNQQDKQYVDN